MMLLIALALFSVTTSGGCRIWSVQDFGGLARVRFAAGLDADIAAEPTKQTIGVPRLVNWTTWTPPFRIHIEIWDHNQEFKAIELAEVVVAYADGSTATFETCWTRNLRPRRFVRGNMLSETIDTDVIARHRKCTIKLAGKMIKTDGSGVPFRTSSQFEPRSFTKTMTELMWKIR